jgi:hypothetical protein
MLLSVGTDLSLSLSFSLPLSLVPIDLCADCVRALRWDGRSLAADASVVRDLFKVNEKIPFQGLLKKDP